MYCLVSIYKHHGLQTEMLPQKHPWLSLYAGPIGKKQQPHSGLSPLFGEKTVVESEPLHTVIEKSESTVIGSANVACLVRICFESAASGLFTN